MICRSRFTRSVAVKTETMTIAESTSIQETIARWGEGFEPHIVEHLTCDGAPAELAEAMAYSMLAPGKRLRPFLVDRCYRLLGGQHADILRLCVAVECLHVFTLMHDDLPCMDDADLRRGKPSSHKVFGEALAVLAGDALLALGLELASRACSDASKSLRIVQLLADAIGSSGAMGGQATDLRSTTEPISENLAAYIHERKTARLFQACCCCGAVAGGADPRTFNNLGTYGRHFGLAFQIADDLLDVSATTNDVGKETGRDATLHRPTYPQAVGIAESRRRARQAIREAVAALSPYGAEAHELRLVAELVVQQES